MNSEQQNQIALFQWRDLWGKTKAGLSLMYAIPNGGMRSKKTASILKAEGVKAGIPDICLPIARGGYNALYIEMKRPAYAGKPKGTLSKKQKEVIAELREAGNKVVVCYGWEQAREEIVEYYESK